MDWAGNGIPIEVHCDAGEIMAQKGSTAKIGIFGLLRRGGLMGEIRLMFIWEVPRYPVIEVGVLE